MEDCRIRGGGILGDEVSEDKWGELGNNRKGGWV